MCFFLMKEIYGPFSCVVNVLFSLILMENFVLFFKCSLNFGAHALLLELNQILYTSQVPIAEHKL